MADLIRLDGEAGAQFVLSADQVQTSLPIGTSFVLIGNTAATSISGTFANLADGAILTVNGNNFQASYAGGDGNDLTLTVVPFYFSISIFYFLRGR
jgi:hypothetical protein